MIYIKSLGIPIVFIGVPKTASEATAKFFIDNVLVSGDMASRLFERDINKVKNDQIDYAKDFPFDGKNPNCHTSASEAIESGIVDPKSEFIGVIRDPIEKQLSLYLSKTRKMNRTSPLKQPRDPLFKLGIQDFRDRVKNNSWEGVTEYQLRSQKSFLEGAKWKIWWCYDHLEDRLNDFLDKYQIELKVPFEKLNRSVENSSAKDFIDKFYDEETLSIVRARHKEDIELYERVKYGT